MQPATAPPVSPAALLSDAERAFLAAHPVIRVAVSRDDYYPFQYIDAQGRIAGFSIEGLMTVFRALGVRAEPVLFDTWSEVLPAIRERRADVVPYIAFTEERSKDLAFTHGVTRDPSALIGREGDTVAQDNPSLAGVRVAVGRDYAAEQLLARVYPKAVPVSFDQVRQGIRAVADGSVQLYLGSMRPALHRISSDRISNLEIKGQVVSPSSWVHMAVRPDWAILARIVSRMVSGDRLGLERELTAAAAPYLGSATLMTTVALDRDELSVLDRYPVLRVGALRGQHALNDFGDESGHSGIAADVTSLITHGLGVPAAVIAFDSTAAMFDAARRGEIDLLPFLVRTPEREMFLKYSAPYVRMPFLLIAHVDAPLYWGLSSLDGRTVALTPGHPLVPVLRDRYPKVRVVKVANAAEALAKVADKEVDATVEIKVYANQQINDHYRDKLRVIEPVSEIPAEFAFAAPAASADLIPLINRALAAIPPAELLRIERRWIAIDQEPVLQLRRYLNIVLPLVGALALIALATIVWNRRLSRESAQRRLAEARLTSLTDQLRLLLESKDVFIATASHELKTPLHGISLTLQWLRGRTRDDEGRQAIARATEATRSLGVLIDDLLDLSQVETGRMVIKQAPFDLLRLVSEVAESFEPMIRQKGLVMLVDFSPSSPRRVSGDALRLRQVLVNLVGNAVKYTAQGRVAVRVAPLPDGAPDGRVVGPPGRLIEFVVSDTGPGIAPERQAQVFEPFAARQAAQPAGSPALPGAGSTGLGLSICRRLVELMGGRIELASTPGQGTVVTVRIALDVLDSGQDGGSSHGDVAAATGGADAGDGGRAPAPVPAAAVVDEAVNLVAAPATRPLVPADVEAVAHEAQDLVATPAAIRPVRVLLVDDDRFSRSMLAMMLEQAGLDVVQADDGEHALETWRETRFDALVTDLHMPGINGVELARRLRAMPRAPDVPRPLLIAASASRTITLGAEDAEALFDRVLEKPLQIQDLADLLQSAGRISPASGPSADPPGS
ncbi:transporter substrate-binding domain-containing protein [uncultured Methylibium sp.]|uniref:ATP-binding protein n=1 Tax=uncultured Methylibium sp. TaxID=381093 RepID=UPI0025DFEEE1|nr:transporter substrate-binding domain-containing protein [uncultured Methylibium sp.]